MLKVIFYILGIVLIVGVGVWFEFNSGDYPRLEQKAKQHQSN